MEQLGFEGMPRRLYPCTPTRLATWLDCPRRYRMTYLDRPMPPKGPPWGHNSLGASVHNALAGWYGGAIVAALNDARGRGVTIRIALDPGHIANDSVISMPVFASTSSKRHSVPFSVWSGQAG